MEYVGSLEGLWTFRFNDPISLLILFSWPLRIWAVNALCFAFAVDFSKNYEKNKIIPDFNLIFKISREFKGARLIKLPHEKSEIVEDFFAGIGITKPYHSEYSAYSMYYGWIENIPEHLIEQDFKVYSSGIENVAKELYNLLNMYEKLANLKNIELPHDWEDFKSRIYRGVRSEELTFMQIKGIKRNLIRNLYDYCQNILKGPLYLYKGSMIDVLKKLRDEKGEAFLLSQMIDKIKGIGPARASKIIDLIK